MVKTKEDFKTLIYINEDRRLEPDLQYFDRDNAELGERGLLVPVIGTETKSSFQSLFEHWVGTEELVYAMADYSEVVEECLAAMYKNALKSVEISVQSGAEAFISWEDSSTTNISPQLFEKYIAPEITQWNRAIHSVGKHYLLHACGYIAALVPIMKNMGIDMIESASPPPTGNIEPWEVSEMLPDHIGVIGGIKPTIFQNCASTELEEYVENLIFRMKGNKFILANYNNCPPGVQPEKFRLVSEIVRRRIN